MVTRGREAPDIHSSSEAYARRFQGPVGRWFLEVQARHVLRSLDPLPAGTTVLDVGGGHGQLTGPLRDAGFRVLTFGSSPSSAGRVRDAGQPGRCEFVAGDLLDLPFPDGAFRAVLCLRILPHLTEWRALVAELCRVSRGIVVLDYPSRRSVNVAAARLFFLKRRLEGDTRPFALFDREQVAGTFRANGFRVDAERAQFLFPMALHRGLGSRRVSRFLERPAAAAGLTGRYGSPVIVKAVRRRHGG